MGFKIDGITSPIRPPAVPSKAGQIVMRKFVKATQGVKNLLYRKGCKEYFSKTVRDAVQHALREATTAADMVMDSLPLCARDNRPAESPGPADSPGGRRSGGVARPGGLARPGGVTRRKTKASKAPPPPPPGPSGPGAVALASGRRRRSLRHTVKRTTVTTTTTTKVDDFDESLRVVGEEESP